MLMQMGTSTRLYLSQPLAAGLSGAETGAARILTDGEDSRATLTIYDTFDTQIMGSGQLLAAIGAELVLDQGPLGGTRVELVFSARAKGRTA